MSCFMNLGAPGWADVLRGGVAVAYRIIRPWLSFAEEFSSRTLGV